MTTRTLILQSLRFHLRSHLGVVLGALIGSAVLTGALLVGDSVRETLRESALARLGPVQCILFSPERMFRQDLAERCAQKAQVRASSGLLLPATVNRQDRSARANQINVIGIQSGSWPAMAKWDSLSASALELWRSGEGVLLNRTLARQLAAKAGDDLVLRVRKPSALGLDAAISQRNDASVALRVQVAGVLGPEATGDLSVFPTQLVPANLFITLAALSKAVDSPQSANLLLTGMVKQGGGRDEQERQRLDSALQEIWVPQDLGLKVEVIEQPQSATGGEVVQPFVQISSQRIFLDPEIVQAAMEARNDVLNGRAADQREADKDKAFSQFLTNGFGVLTYLANLLQAGERATPYSMITAAGLPFVPADMSDDEILVNEWLADDLQLNPGNTLQISYYVVDSGSRLLERTNTFRVRSIVPLKGIYADRTLMPDFPGVAKAESTHDWDAGFPLVYKIREKDEAYWKAHRGTPKAFVTLRAGQHMWGNRFGSLTAVRYAVPANGSVDACREMAIRNLRTNVDANTLGLQFEPVREKALRAASQSQDFAELFLSFSFFLLVSALLLMALLFQFGVEQRMPETGALLALGFRARQVRLMMLLEGVGIALLGGALGAIAGILYASGILWALGSVWRSAVASAPLHFHASLSAIITGFVIASVVASLTIWLAIRKQARQPVSELLAGEIAGPVLRKGRVFPWTAILCGGSASLTLLWAVLSGHSNSAEVFFTLGCLVLLAGLSLIRSWLTKAGQGRADGPFTLTRLAVQGCGRRRSRSIATVALLGAGCFLIVAMGVFRLDSNLDAGRKDSGTGGFSLIGQSSLPIVQDLITGAGRNALGLDEKYTQATKFVPFRVRQGDEASCLNLNRAQKPRLLGVRPELLAGRFRFASVASGFQSGKGWELLSNPPGVAGEIPAIGDAASIAWALGKKLGDTLDYTDEKGRTFKLRLVASLANSILQGNLVIDEAAFVKAFPNESGYRFFLIDAPSAEEVRVSADLSRALEDRGFEVVSAVHRLSEFNAVQNTYLSTFQMLGGLGLLLGSAGVGVVLLRNVFERRGELAIMVAAGFRGRTLRALLLAEHGALLVLGLGLGLFAAAVAVFPAVLSRGQLPYVSLGVTLLAVITNGLLWTWVATRVALRGNLLEALRNE